MSNFYPFNLNMRTGSFNTTPIVGPDTGCPLNTHPAWERVIGAGDSVFCWANRNGTSVSINGTSDIVKNLAFNRKFSIDGTVGCTIAYVPTGSQNWLLPLAGRMINGNNLLGARWNDGKFEVVQRRNGVWATLFSGGPAPVIGDKVILSLSSKYWKLIINGVTVSEGETNLANNPGYWGISQHRSGDLNGHTIFTDFFMVEDVSKYFPTFIVDISGLIKNISLTISLPNGEAGVITWGDGSKEDLVGPIDKVTYDHTYSSNGSYIIFISQNITYLSISGGEISGEFSKLPRALKYFMRMFNNTFTGNILDLPSDLEFFQCGGMNTLSGNLSDVSAKLTEIYFYGLCNIRGDITDLKSTIKRIDIYGISAITGDIANLPDGIIHFGAKGNNTITGDIANIPDTITELYLMGNNTITGDISSLSINFDTLYCEGFNTIFGDIANLPPNIDQLYCYGENSITGDIDTLPDAIKYFQVRGNNTVSGNITNMPPNLKAFECFGNNTITGDIATILISLENFDCGGENTIFGELSTLHNEMKKFACSGKNIIAGYTTKTWASTMFYLILSPVIPGGLTSAEIDQLLIELSNTNWDISGRVDLIGSNAPRTPASDTAITTLISKSVVITTNQTVTHNGETVNYNSEIIYSPLMEG